MTGLNKEMYTEERLPNEEKEFLRGYDWCLEMAVDNFFNNIDVMESDYIEKLLNEPLPESLINEYVVSHRFTTLDEAPEETRKVTTYGDYFRMHLLEWIEAERRALIISMIDDMPEGEGGED